MRVAHFTTHLNMGGIPVYIETLSRALNYLGVEQIVFSSGGSLEEKLVQDNVRSFVYDLKTKFEFHPKILWALPAIIRDLKREKIQLIHAHTRVGQVLAAYVEKLTGIPFVSTSHGFYKFRLGRRLFPSWGKKVIAISEPVRNDLIQTHRLNASRVVRIRNGIELDHFVQASSPEFKQASRKKWGIEPGQFVVSMISRMIEEKGIEDLIEAVSILFLKHPRLRVFIVGDGASRSEFEKRAHEHNVGNLITFTGNLLDVREILAASHVFVHPVRVSEGFGLSIAEAMAAGLPVLVTDQWALSQLMKDRGVGAIIKSRDPKKIAEVLDVWMQHPEQIVEMGRNAQTAAIEFFDIKRMATSVLEVYKEALA